MSYTAIVDIDLSAFLHNVACVKHHAPKAGIIAMVKADAYGHGLIALSQVLDKTVILGVARLEEALTLRRAGFTHRILLMEGFFEPWELDLIVAATLEIVVHQEAQIQMLMAHRFEAPLTVWLKIDTGMHRLGLPPSAFLQAWQTLKNHPDIHPDMSILSHFACADERDHPMTQQQTALFFSTVKSVSAPCSLANSAAILAWPETHLDWVRPGLMLYGISPFAGRIGREEGLKPVMTLHSRLLSIQTHQAGDKLGYGLTYTCPEAMPVGIVAIGYGDGYPRYIPAEGVPILVNDQRTQVIGRVSMDMLMVDLRPISNPVIGDKVILWGNGLPIEEIAMHAKTSAYELLCGMTPRVARRYHHVHEEEQIRRPYP